MIGLVFLWQDSAQSHDSLRPAILFGARSEQEKKEIPTRFILRTTGEIIIFTRMDEKIFKKHQPAIINIAQRLYDTSPVESLTYADPRIVNGQACYVAQINGRVVGYVFAYEDKNKLAIETLGVIKDREGKGIANALLWIVTMEAQNRNISIIAVKGVNSGNKRMLEFLKMHEFNIPKDIDSGKRFNSEVPVSSVFKKVSEKLSRDMLLVIKPSLLSRIKNILNSI